jgi:hypothetical protein
MTVLSSNPCGGLNVSQPATTSSGGQPVNVTVNNNESSGCGCGCGSGSSSDSGSGSGTGTNPGSGKPTTPTTPPGGVTPPANSEPRKPVGGCIPLASPYFTDYGVNPGMKFEQDSGLGTAIRTAALTLYDSTKESLVTATIQVEAYSYQELSGAVGYGGIMIPIPGKGVSNILINYPGAPTFGADAWGRTSGYPIQFNDHYGAWKGINKNICIPIAKTTICPDVEFSPATFRRYSGSLTLDMSSSAGIVSIDGMLPSPAGIGFLFGPHNPPIPDDPAWLQITLCSVTILKAGQTGGGTGDGTPGKKIDPPIDPPPPPGPTDKTVDVDCITLGFSHPFNSATFTETDLNLSALITTAASSNAAGSDKLKAGEIIKSAKFKLMAVSENGAKAFIGTNIDGSTLDNYLKLTGSDGVQIPLPGSYAEWVRYDEQVLIGHTWNETCNMSLIGSNILLNAKMYQYVGISHNHSPADMNDGAWLDGCLTSFVKTTNNPCGSIPFDAAPTTAFKDCFYTSPIGKVITLTTGGLMVDVGIGLLTKFTKLESGNYTLSGIMAAVQNGAGNYNFIGFGVSDFDTKTALFQENLATGATTSEADMPFTKSFDITQDQSVEIWFGVGGFGGNFPRDFKCELKELHFVKN